MIQKHLAFQVVALDSYNFPRILPEGLSIDPTSDLNLIFSLCFCFFSHVISFISSLSENIHVKVRDLIEHQSVFVL